MQRSPLASLKLLYWLVGVTQFMDDALADGARVALLCGTNSTEEDDIGSAAAYAFGVQRARHMQIVNTWGDQDGDIGSSSSGSSREDEGSSALADSNDSLAREAAAAQAKVSRGSAALLIFPGAQSFRDFLRRSQLGSLASDALPSHYSLALPECRWMLCLR